MAFSLCGSGVRTNVGSFDCDQARKFPKKLTIGGKRFSPLECATSDSYKTAKVAATKLDTGNTDKLFVINNLQDPQDTTEANKTGQVGEGPMQVLVEGRPAFTYRVEIGQDLFKRLRKLNKQTVSVTTYDDAGNDWGSVDSTGYFGGAKALFFISGNTQQTASTPVSALITLTYLSATEYNDQAAYVPVELGEFEPTGLLDAYLRYVSNAANVFKIAVEIPTAQMGKVINVAEKHSADLVAGLFAAATGATYSTALAITSVAYDATLKVMTVTFDSTAYTALANGTKIRLALDPVADLDAANITGIEGVPVILTKAA